MSDVVIPLQAAPVQALSATLNGQSCRIVITQRLTGLFLDLYLNDTAVVLGVQCLNNNKIVRDAYRGFVGDLTFWDTQGSNDPTYDGLGGRYVLLYVS